MGAKSEPEVEKFFETLTKKFSKKVVDDTEEIKKLLLEERFEDAKIVLEELINTNPSPENFSLLIKSLIGLKNFDEIEQIIKSLSSDIIKDSMVQVAISSYELLKNSNVDSSKSEILDKIKKNPSDLDARMNYSKILLKENNFSECIDVLLEMFKEDREWKEGLAKKQLLSIFEHLGSDDELSKKGRRSLTSLIFV